MGTTMFLTFTPTEWEIIEDRLIGVPDCIADALEIDISVVEAIRVHSKNHKQVTLLVPQGSEAALAEALEGSTYLATSDDAARCGQLSADRFRKLRKAAQSAAQKLRDAGIDCGDVPAY
jgi:AICAR transformylase/IMP cyclohydrolase PurH